MLHTWILDSEGQIDVFVLDYEFHNGPVCTVCSDAFCIWCHINWKDLECPGEY